MASENEKDDKRRAQKMADEMSNTTQMVWRWLSEVVFNIDNLKNRPGWRKVEIREFLNGEKSPMTGYRYENYIRKRARKMAYRIKMEGGQPPEDGCAAMARAQLLGAMSELQELGAVKVDGNVLTVLLDYHGMSFNPYANSRKEN